MMTLSFTLKGEENIYMTLYGKQVYFCTELGKMLRETETSCSNHN